MIFLHQNPGAFRGAERGNLPQVLDFMVLYYTVGEGGNENFGLLLPKLTGWPARSEPMGPQNTLFCIYSV